MWAIFRNHDFTGDELGIKFFCGSEKILADPVAPWLCVSFRPEHWAKFIQKSRAEELFFKFLQCACQVFKGRPLINIMDINKTNDPLFIDDKQSPFRYSVRTQHTILLGYRSVWPKI